MPYLTRKVEEKMKKMEQEDGEARETEDVDNLVLPPPKSLLLYLVRMGSFTSTPKMLNVDNQDDDIEVSDDATKEYLLKLCRNALITKPPLLRRNFHRHLREPESDVPEERGTNSNTCLRIMQWNVLSQALGEKNDNFVACPPEAIEWKTRRFRLLEEILVYNADVLCLQEVDHFNFLQKTLGPLGFKGIFFPKPDSPCLYIRDNNGADGCALFYNSNKLDVVHVDTRVLEVWRVQSNQVAILAVLRFKTTGEIFCIVTTHLKARQGTLLTTLRNQQGKDLTDFINSNYDSTMPLFVCGDFNAEPTEPVYVTMTSHEENHLGLTSAYAAMCSPSNPQEPEFTTWKIREDGEVRHTIDYIFYNAQHLIPESALLFPSEEEIGVGRVPSYQYPSDHFSLVCDFRFI